MFSKLFKKKDPKEPLKSAAAPASPVKPDKKASGQTSADTAATLTEEEKAAAKQAAKEAAIAAYKEKRMLTLSRFFEIAGLPFPDKFNDRKDHVISDFTADPRRLTEDSVFLFWEKAPLSVGDPLAALQKAVDSHCLCIISSLPCDAENSVIIDEKTEDGRSVIIEAYIRASHYIRSIHKAKVISVTGSVGKTSTKEMIEAVLRHHYKRPIISKGNNNSMYSITRNIQSLRRTTNVYLQEVGAFVPRTIEYSARQLEVDMAVYTNIGHSHIESYGSAEAIKEDKLSLSTFGKPDGLAFINYDDPVLMGHPFTQKTIIYSLKDPSAMYYASDIVRDDDGYRFTICENMPTDMEALHGQASASSTQAADRTSASAQTSKKPSADAISAGSQPQRFPARIHTLGEHNVLNAVVAFAVGRALKIKPEEILEGLETYRASGMRQNIVQAGKYRIFADCYNSSLVAVQNTLKVVDELQIPAGNQKILVLGDVTSLGDLAEETHRQIGQEVASHQSDLFIGYGINMKYAVEEALKAGVHAVYYEDRSEMEAALKAAASPGDLVLFKASHAVNLGATMDKLFGTDFNESSAIGHKQFDLVIKDDFEYYIFENSASIKTYLGTDEHVTVPSHIEATVTDELHEVEVTKNLPVEKIGKTAFREKTFVKEVTLPETIVRIRDGAFKGSGLTHFEGPTSLLSIGDEAFADCPDLQEVLLTETTDQLGEKLLENSPQAVLKYK